MHSRKVVVGSRRYALLLVTVLLSGVFLSSMPYAMADDDDDKKEKIKKLKQKIWEVLEQKKKDKKCPEKFKYGEICDKKKPKVDIISPEKREVVNGPSVTISAAASDELSGIKIVQVKIDRSGYSDAVLNAGVWDFTTDLDPGRHFVFVKAIDNAGNIKRDFVFFNVI